MAKNAGQKVKLLYIIQMLEESSDEDHPLSTAEIISRLAENGIHSERKSIYDDIESLKNFGYDIISIKSRLGGGYYLGSREFELAELKLLADAVLSSKFITTKKSRDLIKKLEQKASPSDAKRLQRQIIVAGRVKTENESIYYSIDTIHCAIQDNKQISFIYLDWSLSKRLEPRPNGNKVVSPWALVWREENYYLVAYDHEDEKIKHYRVDKMGSVEILKNPREGMQQFERMDIAAYTNRTFGMFSGVEKMITLRFPNRLTGVVMDRFGKEASFRPDGSDYFLVRASVAVSPQFYGWLAGLGKEATVVRPKEVRDEYIEWLTGILDANMKANSNENTDE